MTSQRADGSDWKQRLDAVTDRHRTDDVTIELLSKEFGDEYEVERLPLAYVEYDPHDDAFAVAVGGRDRRYPVVLRHTIAHPKKVDIEGNVIAGEPVAIRVVAPDDSETVITVQPHREVA